MTSRGRLHGHHAGALAIKVYVCTNPECEVHHRRAPPVQCVCGGIQFDKFDSVTEANQWASLRMQERRGLISDLKRQVWFPLLAVGEQGPVKVGSYVADFVYTQDEKVVIGDAKPDAGTDPVFDLKARWMAAMGKPITILTPKGR